jgi:galactonate dehydratase
MQGDDWGHRPGHQPFIKGASMKITEIRTYLVNANGSKRSDRPRGRNWLFCKIITDAGIYGVGEGGGWPEVARHGIEEVAPLLIGEDPFAIERLWLRVYDLLHGHGLTGSVRGGVISAIDMALWDIKGKALGAPVYELLGGKVREAIRIYAPASSVEEARKLVERGYTAFKCGPSPKVLAALRDALGYELEIGVHCHGEFSPAGALQLAKAIEPYQPAFLEEPTDPDDLDALQWLGGKTSVPLAAGERLFSKWAFRDLLQRRAIEIAQPEITRIGGITEAKKIAALAEAFLVKVAPHDGSAGPVAEMANLHVLAASPNCLFLEHLANDVPWRAEVAKGVIPEEDGHIPVPALPGLGIDLDEEAIAAHPPYGVAELQYHFRTPEEMQAHRLP